ncbi:hypothetical protein JCM10212_001050 [Sporobolomyces blumeae]
MIWSLPAAIVISLEHLRRRVGDVRTQALRAAAIAAGLTLWWDMEQSGSDRAHRWATTVALLTGPGAVLPADWKVRTVRVLAVSEANRLDILAHQYGGLRLGVIEATFSELRIIMHSLTHREDSLAKSPFEAQSRRSVLGGF